jgi:hypothetical protein
MTNSNNQTNGVTIKNIEALASGMQFCTSMWQPYDGICEYDYDGQQYICNDMPDGCTLCDCDGTYYKDL